MTYNPKKNYYVPKKERPVYTELDKSEWKVSAVTQRAVNAVRKAIIRKGGERETLIRMVVKEEDMVLFTHNVENRLVALFRNLYDSVVLLEIQSPEYDVKQSRKALLKKAEKEHRRQLKKHEESNK